MGQAVKGDLLYVKIPIEKEPAAVYNKKGQKNEKRKPHSQEKGFKKIIVPKAPGFSSLKSVHTKKRSFVLNARC